MENLQALNNLNYQAKSWLNPNDQACLHCMAITINQDGFFMSLGSIDEPENKLEFAHYWEGLYWTKKGTKLVKFLQEFKSDLEEFADSCSSGQLEGFASAFQTGDKTYYFESAFVEEFGGIGIELSDNKQEHFSYAFLEDKPELRKELAIVCNSIANAVDLACKPLFNFIPTHSY
ncbi:MAG: hypothetical protein LCH37_14875 [Bacteroidetes bacterium]|nr:hypothetical protein [Bacteroidota bacterium]